DEFFTNIGGDYNHDFKDDDEIDYQIETNKKLAIDSAVDSDDSPSSSCNHYWQLWFWKSDQWYIEWDYGLQKLAKPFNGRQRLLKLFDQLLPLSDIVIPSDYSIFRELIRPKWEDSANLNGGAWIIEFERCSLITDMKLMENIWHSLVEFIVEKHCNNNDCSLFKHICGIKISIRFKVFIISIWIDTFNDLSIIFPIGIRIQSIIMEIIQNNRRIRLSETIDNSTTTTTTSLYHYHTLPLLLFRSHIVSKRIAANKDVNIIGGCSAAAAAAAGGKKYFNSAGLFNHHLKSKNK
uniref:Eukaryotic translation initiation factor 4E-like n=1 Tax=Dermatophagoides pteronyssinus TaxID=6956 RepID=A0A6P6YK36_DERPT